MFTICKYATKRANNKLFMFYKAWVLSMKTTHKNLKVNLEHNVEDIVTWNVTFIGSLAMQHVTQCMWDTQYLILTNFTDLTNLSNNLFAEI